MATRGRRPGLRHGDGEGPEVAERPAGRHTEQGLEGTKTMTKRTRKFDSEEGERTAQALFTFMGKVRLYNAEARAAAIRIIEAEAKNESDPVEKKFFETAVEFIKNVGDKHDQVMRETYENI
jgi:hypothetical protein